MNENEQGLQRFWRRRWFFRVLGVFVLLAVVGAVAVEWGLRQLEPMMRRKVVATLSARFHSPVELDRLELSLRQGVIVRGSGLRILYLPGRAKPDAASSTPPMAMMRSFEFQTGLWELLRPTTHVLSVKVDGLEIHLTPKRAGSNDGVEKQKMPMEGIFVDRIVCTNAHVVIDKNDPAKKPFEMAVPDLVLTNVGLDKPLGYEADVVNPKPVGQVHATGQIGPWQGDEPRDTPIEGSYAFTHADLSTIRGLGGILASTGNYKGTLGEITVDGITDTPDFRLDISEHPVFLHTQFHAVVDGTTGNVKLDPVAARLGRSGFTATGSVVQAPGSGHDIDLNVVMDRGRIEDMLALTMKANPPLMRGALVFKARVRIPPGTESVTRRVRVEGTFTIREAMLNNPKKQAQMDSLSERAQGKPHLANAQDAQTVTASMSGGLSIANAVLEVKEADYTMPGADVKLNGQVHLVESTYDFHGTARTKATASQMTTGWKSLLLKPLDPLLKKNGAGLELPIKMSGTKGDYDLRLDFPHNTKGPGVVAPVK